MSVTASCSDDLVDQTNVTAGEREVEDLEERQKAGEERSVNIYQTLPQTTLRLSIIAVSCSRMWQWNM